MAIGIKDRVTFQLSINGMNVPFENNTLDFFHLVESVRLNVPAMTVQIKDSSRFFSRNDLLVDGATIQATLGIEDKKIVFPMRYFTHKETQVGGSPTFRIYAYLDAPKFWTSSMPSTIRGTASGALERVCQDTGLRYEGISTNDSQLWMPENRKCMDFAKQIASRAFMDESSCCQMFVGTDKVMRMVNVTEFDKFPVVQSFANMPGTNQSSITDVRVLNKSGFFNSISGYKDQHVNQSFLKETEIIKDAKVNKNSLKLMMSESVRQTIAQNRIMHGPIDVGNVNDNYQRGKYQNQRLGNLFSAGLEIVTPNLCEASVLQIVDAQISRPEADTIASVSGKYMLTSKVYYLTNNNFAHKLEMFRHGLNDRSENTQS